MNAFFFTAELASEPIDDLKLPHGYALDYSIQLAGVTLDCVRVEIEDAHDQHNGDPAEAAIVIFAERLAEILGGIGGLVERLEEVETDTSAARAQRRARY